MNPRAPAAPAKGPWPSLRSETGSRCRSRPERNNATSVFAQWEVGDKGSMGAWEMRGRAQGWLDRDLRRMRRGGAEDIGPGSLGTCCDVESNGACSRHCGCWRVRKRSEKSRGEMAVG